MTWPPCLFWKSDFRKPVPTDYFFCFAPKAPEVAHYADFHNAVVCPPVNKMQELREKNLRERLNSCPLSHVPSYFAIFPNTNPAAAKTSVPTTASPPIIIPSVFILSRISGR